MKSIQSDHTLISRTDKIQTEILQIGLGNPPDLIPSDALLSSNKLEHSFTTKLDHCQDIENSFSFKVYNEQSAQSTSPVNCNCATSDKMRLTKRGTDDEHYNLYLPLLRKQGKNK